MSWTYSGDPTLSVRDQVRFLLGDTNSNHQIFQDEELDWLIGEQSNAYLAAASAAETAASAFVSSSNGSVQTKTVGALSITYQDAEKATEYKKLANSLRVRAALYGAVLAPYSGGISKSDKTTNEQDTDWDKPAFKRGMLDNPGTDPDNPVYRGEHITYPS